MMFKPEVKKNKMNFRHDELKLAKNYLFVETIRINVLIRCTTFIYVLACSSNKTLYQTNTVLAADHNTRIDPYFKPIQFWLQIYLI